MNTGPRALGSDEPARTAASAAGAADSERGPYRPGYELLAEQILQLIGELALAPGDRMPTEAELSQRLGASRTMVREAVKILSAIGRVRAHKGRGLYVADGESMLGARSMFFVCKKLTVILPRHQSNAVSLGHPFYVGRA